MESINYDKPCNKSSDCKSNVCELIYENGKPKLETTFKNGLKDGTHIEWDESGEKVIEGKFKKGVLISKASLGKSS